MTAGSDRALNLLKCLLALLWWNSAFNANTKLVEAGHMWASRITLAAGAALALAALVRRRRRARGPPVVFGGDEPIVMMDAVHGMACRLVHGVPYVTFITQAGLDALRAHFAPRPTDIFVATSPKCGTTWAQQLVLLLVRGGAASAVRDPMIEAPWLERGVCLGELTLDGEPADGARGGGGGRRVYKTHAPWELAPWRALGDAKVVYVARNAKDACVSAFYHNRAIPGHAYDGPWENFVKVYLDGRLEHGRWADHVRGWWAMRCARPAQICWVTYEELHARPREAVGRIARFLEVDGAATDALVDAAIAGAAFDTMKRQSAARGGGPARKKGGAGHFREGAPPGGWRRHFTVAQSLEFDAALAESLADLPDGLEFDYGDGEVWSTRGGAFLREDVPVSRPEQVPESEFREIAVVTSQPDLQAQAAEAQLGPHLREA